MTPDRFSDEAREMQRRVQAGELPATSAWSLRDALAGDLMVLGFGLVELACSPEIDEKMLERVRLHIRRIERKLQLAADTEQNPELPRDLTIVGDRQAAVQRGEQPAFDLVQLGDALRQDVSSLGGFVSILRRSGAADVAEQMWAALGRIDDKIDAAFNEAWRRRAAG